MQLVWRDNRTEYLPVILILLIQKSHIQMPVFGNFSWKQNYWTNIVFFWARVNVAMEKQDICLCFSVVITLVLSFDKILQTFSSAHSSSRHFVFYFTELHKFFTFTYNRWFEIKQQLCFFYQLTVVGKLWLRSISDYMCKYLW